MDLSLVARGATPIQLDKPRLLFFDKAATWALMQRYGARFAQALYTASEDRSGNVELKLESMDALEVYLHLGLQADARANGETLTPAQVAEWLIPSRISDIFRTVVVALTRGIHTPPAPGDAGKADAAAARPAAAAGKRASRQGSTTRKPSASRTARSTKRPSSSGRKR